HSAISWRPPQAFAKHPSRYASPSRSQTTSAFRFPHRVIPGGWLVIHQSILQLDGIPPAFTRFVEIPRQTGGQHLRSQMHYILRLVLAPRGVRRDPGSPPLKALLLTLGAGFVVARSHGQRPRIA